jgi:ribosome-associated translation inhibitor RaiA
VILVSHQHTNDMTLKWNLATKGLRPHGQLRQKLQQKIRKLETHLEHFPPDAVFLQVNLERHPKRLWFRAALTLRLPSNILRAAKSGPDPVPPFDLAVRALLREVAVLKAALRHKSAWQRGVRGAALSERKLRGSAEVLAEAAAS